MCRCFLGFLPRCLSIGCLPTGGPGPVFAIHWRSEAHGPVLQRCSGRHSRCCKDVFFIVVYSLLVAANVCKNIWKDVYLAENDSRKYTISGVSVNHCAKPATFGLAKRVQLPYFLLAPACNMALAAGARQWLPCPLCHARSRFLAVGGRAVRQTAAVLPFLSNRFIISPGSATAWLSEGCGLGRFEWQNGAFCSPKRALLRPR